MKGEAAARAGGPIPKLPAGKNAALMALGKNRHGEDATWREIDANWRSLPREEQMAVKAQWNAEAMGEQEFADDSKLKAALIYFRRWPIQRDANGFPTE